MGIGGNTRTPLALHLERLRVPLTSPPNFVLSRVVATTISSALNPSQRPTRETKHAQLYHCGYSGYYIDGFRRRSSHGQGTYVLQRDQTTSGVETNLVPRRKPRS